MWVIYHPTISCGLDPLEVWINQWSLVHWFDWLLKADGLCSAPLPPILGLTVPVWSLVWLTLLTIVLLFTWASFKGEKSN
jgi:disulfide bond formation protein DsbB